MRILLSATVLAIAFTLLYPAQARAEEAKPAGDIQNLTSTVNAILESQLRTDKALAGMQQTVYAMQSRVNALQEELAYMKEQAMTDEQRSMKKYTLSDLAKAQAGYVSRLTQGGSYWETTEFKMNDDGTATLIGRGTAVLNSGSSSNNAGQGALLYTTFTDLDDPLFKKCRALLESTSKASWPVSTTLEVFGLGTYETGPADPTNSEHNITSAFAFRLGKLTQCEQVKMP
ncbi:MAG: hypothetical protein ACAH80_04000 [Alphaproteobacteria bacterium]